MPGLETIPIIQLFSCAGSPAECCTCTQVFDLCRNPRRQDFVPIFQMRKPRPKGEMTYAKSHGEGRGGAGIGIRRPQSLFLLPTPPGLQSRFRSCQCRAGNHSARDRRD